MVGREAKENRAITDDVAAAVLKWGRGQAFTGFPWDLTDFFFFFLR
jgi:apolipoprotein N-acyltransferase